MARRFARGAGYRGPPAIAIVDPEPSAVIAETLALALVVASTAPVRARTALALPPDNVARAHRGLLPRKVVRTRALRGRRVVLLPRAPTWLGEPSDPGVDEGAAEPALDGAVTPVVLVEPASAEAPAEAPAEALPVLSASVEGAAVQWMLVRSRAAWEEPAVEAAIAEPELEVMLVRRPRAP